MLRQLYGKTLLELLHSGKRIINIDESWLPSMSFTRKKWCVRGQKNTHPFRDFSQRVNMIVALDTSGRVYLSLT